MGMIVPHYQRKFHDTSRHFLQKNMYLTACCCSVTKLCLALCDLRTAACQTSLSFTISQSLCKLMSIESGMPFNHLILCYPLLFCPQSFLASGSFPMSWLFTSGGQSIGASASVLPMNIQGWFPFWLTGFISLQSKGLSRVFFSTTVRKYQFFGAQLSSWSNSHIHTWLLEEPQLWLYGPLSAKWCLCFLIQSLGLS